VARSFVRTQRILISRLFIIIIVVLILISRSRWEDSLVGPGLFLAGAVLIGFAVVGRLWCSMYISGYKSGTLITEGPYSMCRNPLYFFSFLGAIGAGLATETFLIPICLLLAFAFYYPMVIKAEQKKLAGIHGEAFSDYCKKVPAFFPSFKLFKEPDEYTVKPKIFRKTLFEVLWFVVLLGVLEIKEGLTQAGVLRAIFKMF
jgi:protein-S-isoprenylcysteine O-methyltransferase Ste14